MLELKNTFDFSQGTLIKPIHCKTSRRLLEFAVISKTNHIKNVQGFTKSHYTLRTSYWTKTNQNRKRIGKKKKKQKQKTPQKHKTHTHTHTHIYMWRRVTWESGHAVYYNQKRKRKAPLCVPGIFFLPPRIFFSSPYLAN